MAARPLVASLCCLIIVVVSSSMNSSSTSSSSFSSRSSPTSTASSSSSKGLGESRLHLSKSSKPPSQGLLDVRDGVSNIFDAISSTSSPPSSSASKNAALRKRRNRSRVVNAYTAPFTQPLGKPSPVSFTPTSMTGSNLALSAPSSFSSLTQSPSRSLEQSRSKTGSERTPSSFSTPKPSSSSFSSLSSLVKRQVKRSSRIPIYLAVLVPREKFRSFSVEKVSPAITLATEHVASLQILPRYQLVTLYRDSECKDGAAMHQAIEFYFYGKVNVFLGPVCNYAAAGVARQAKYWNLPVITSGATALAFSAGRSTSFTTLTRVGPNFDHMTDIFLAMFRYYGFHKVNLVYDSEAQNSDMDKTCFLSMTALNDNFSRKDKFNGTHDVVKYIQKTDIVHILKERIGNEFADISIPFSFGVLYLQDQSVETPQTVLS